MTINEERFAVQLLGVVEKRSKRLLSQGEERPSCHDLQLNWDKNQGNLDQDLNIAL